MKGPRSAKTKDAQMKCPGAFAPGHFWPARPDGKRNKDVGLLGLGAGDGAGGLEGAVGGARQLPGLGAGGDRVVVPGAALHVAEIVLRGPVGGAENVGHETGEVGDEDRRYLAAGVFFLMILMISSASLRPAT